MSNFADALLPRIVTEQAPGPKSIELARRLQNVESPDITFISESFPVFWQRGQGCLVTDVDGNRYVDATSSFGVLGLGHCHPRVVAAIADQANRLIHGMGDVHPSAIKVELLEAISGISPIPDSLAILGQNGSDAVEAAMKTAMLATGKPGVLAFARGYHGLTYGALGPTARGFFREPFESQRGKIARHLPFNCPVEQIAEVLDARRGPLEIGAVIVEPIQGRGGIWPAKRGWLAELAKVCREAGVLLIFDEIFTGLGRTGTWFACEHENVTPDLLCIGKTLGSGLPISACLGSRETISRAWGKSTGEAKHTFTFLGNPLACAAAIATLKVLQEERLIEGVSSKGLYFKSLLHSLADGSGGLIAEVRGRGLMLGLQFPDSDAVSFIVTEALRLGLIVLPAGDKGDVLELIPPYVVEDAQLEYIVRAIQECITEYQSRADTIPKEPQSRLSQK